MTWSAGEKSASMFSGVPTKIETKAVLTSLTVIEAWNGRLVDCPAANSSVGGTSIANSIWQIGDVWAVAGVVPGELITPVTAATTSAKPARRRPGCRNRPAALNTSSDTFRSFLPSSQTLPLVPLRLTCPSGVQESQ